MDSCVAVEKELDRVIKKFTAINEHSGRVIEDVISHILQFRNVLAERKYCAFPKCKTRRNNFKTKQLYHLIIDCSEINKTHSGLVSGPDDAELTQSQRVYLKDALTSDKEKLQKLTADHRDLHGTVSKVGKAIDRNFESDFTATTRNDVFATDRNVQLLNTIIAQHFFRQGMEDVAKNLIKVGLR